jgi:hypothetical protein
VKNEDILSFGKLFNDELTLDNISRYKCFSLKIISHLVSFLLFSEQSRIIILFVQAFK